MTRVISAQRPSVLARAKASASRVAIAPHFARQTVSGRTGGTIRRGAVIITVTPRKDRRPQGPFFVLRDRFKHRMTNREPVLDTLNRPLHDLRISVTDRCNFRCTYCMPKEVFGRDYAFLPRDQLLSFEEITRLTRLFVGLGVEKVRLTGGEPLLRRDFEKLVDMLAGIDGLNDIAMTTNGSLLTA